MSRLHDCATGVVPRKEWSKSERIYFTLGPSPFIAMLAWPVALVLLVLRVFGVGEWTGVIDAALIPFVPLLLIAFFALLVGAISLLERIVRQLRR